jgi:hypothetical protein
MNSNSKIIKTLFYIVIAIVILVAIVILFSSGGKVDLLSDSNKKNDRDEKSLEERKEIFKHRHKKLQALIERKKELNIKLKKKFRIIYFCVRLLLLFIWFVFNLILWEFHIANSLGDFLNFNEAVLLLLFALNFLFFRNLIGLKEIIDYVKNYIENAVYKKYIQIEIQIENHSTEAVYLENEMKKIEDEIIMNNNLKNLIDTI